MFKTLMFCGGAVALGTAALSIPLDPAVLETLGIGGGEAATHEQALPAAPPVQRMRIVSMAPDTEGAKLEIRRVALTSSYSSAASARSTTSTQLRPVVPRDFSLRTTAAPKTHHEPAPARPVVALQTNRLNDVELSRRIQRELRRVGCYSGRIDGDWGPASRYAMATFTRLVNASLPTEKPDVILLTLLRRHHGDGCDGPLNRRSIEAHRQPDPATTPWRTRIVTPKLVQQPTRVVERSAPTTSKPRIITAGRVGYVPTPVEVRVQPPRMIAQQQIQTNSNFSENRMSLGAPVERPLTTGSVAPITAPQPQRATRSSRFRAYVPQKRVRNTRERRRYRSSRRARKSWQRRVFNNLNGS